MILMSKKNSASDQKKDVALIERDEKTNNNTEKPAEEPVYDAVEKVAESVDLNLTVESVEDTNEEVAPAEEVKAQKADLVKNTSEAPNKEKKNRYDIGYFFELTGKSMLNNIAMVLASLLVLASCLIVLGSCFLILLNIDVNLDRLGSLNQIVVYCEYDMDEDEVAAVGEKLATLSNVQSVTPVSKEDALEDLVSDYSEYSGIFDYLFENGENPLSDSFIVRYAENEYVGELIYGISAVDGVRRVNNRADLSVKAENLRRGVVFVFIAFFALLLLTSLFVIINTIKLALHFRRYDITVMRYIGSTNVFVLTPFIMEGVIIGIVAAVVAALVQQLIYSYILRATAEAFEMLYFVPFGECGWIVWLLFVIIGVLCGLFGSMISIRKNLNA